MVEVYNDSDEEDSVTYTGVATVNGDLVPVMAEGTSSPDWVDEDSDAYVTVDEDGEGATVHNAGDVMSSDTTDADVEIVANDKIGYSDAQSMFESYDRDNPRLSAIMASGLSFGTPDFEAVE